MFECEEEDTPYTLQMLMLLKIILCVHLFEPVYLRVAQYPLNLNPNPSKLNKIQKLKKKNSSQFLHNATMQ
jgi:hypothetical protein